MDDQISRNDNDMLIGCENLYVSYALADLRKIANVEQLPSVRPEERTETHTCDCISIQYAINALWKIFCNRPLDSDRWVLDDVLR